MANVMIKIYAREMNEEFGSKFPEEIYSLHTSEESRRLQ